MIIKRFEPAFKLAQLAQTSPPGGPLRYDGGMNELAPAKAVRTRTRGASKLRGQVVFMFAFDIAYDMKRVDPRHLLGQPVGTFQMDASKRNPKQLFFFRPQTVRLPPCEKFTDRGLLRLERVVKIMPVGAISISIKVPFEVDELRELVEFHDIRFRDGSTMAEEARQLGEQIRLELLPILISPVPRITDVEAYTVFCVDGPLQRIYGEPEIGSDPDDRSNAAAEDVGAEQWLHTHRRDVAAVLTQEPDADLLSEQEANESSSKYVSYYLDDLVVIDWDAAIIVDDPREFDETLYIMELANVQLAELEAYDRLLDDAVDTAYRDIRQRTRWLNRSRVTRELRELRIDSARINDELSNITKFFGDWHLARLYRGMAERFHLEDWHKSVRAKLQAIDEIYELLHADSNHRMMLSLELAVVILFVIEVAKSFLWK